MKRLIAALLALVLIGQAAAWGDGRGTIPSALGTLYSLVLTGTTSGSTTVKPTAAASGTLTLPAATDTLVGKATTDTFTNKTFAASNIDQSFVASSAAVTYTSNTTLSTLTGLSIALIAGKTYVCHGHVTVTSSAAAGGIQVALVATASLTATSATFNATNWNGTTLNAKTTATTLGTAIGSSANAVTDVDIVGSIVVNAAGTINLQAAQNTSNGTSTVVGQGSTLFCKRTT